METEQWWVFGIGFFIIGCSMAFLAPTCYPYSDETLIACLVARHLYAVPGMILSLLGLLFTICAIFEGAK